MTLKENRHIEYKESMTNTFLKTVSAYSNCEGGKIIFGMTDQGEVVGVNNPKQLCMDIENRINDSISPKPDYMLEVNQEKRLVILTVAEGRFKPYFYHGKAYRRSDTASIEMDQIELKRLVLEGENLYFEQLSCNEENLEFTYFERKLKERIGVESLNNDMLRTLGFYTKKY
jgi:ATP-dependent DNA helicase RecG